MLNNVLLFALIGLFLLASYYDVKSRIIPNRVVGLIFLVALLYLWINFDSYNWSIIHTVSFILANVFWIGSFYLSKGGFGGADAKIFMAVSFFFYPMTYWYFVVLSFGLGIILGLLIKVIYKNNMTIPLVVPISLSFIFFTISTLL